MRPQFRAQARLVISSAGAFWRVRQTQAPILRAHLMCLNCAGELWQGRAMRKPPHYQCRNCVQICTDGVSSGLNAAQSARRAHQPLYILAKFPRSRYHFYSRTNHFYGFQSRNTLK